MNPHLSQAQLLKLIDALNGGTDYPKHTDDPLVNATVDYLVCGEEALPWENLDPLDKEIYREEAKIPADD